MKGREKEILYNKYMEVIVVNIIGITCSLCNERGVFYRDSKMLIYQIQPTNVVHTIWAALVHIRVATFIT